MRKWAGFAVRMAITARISLPRSPRELCSLFCGGHGFCGGDVYSADSRICLFYLVFCNLATALQNGTGLCYPDGDTCPPQIGHVELAVFEQQR